MIEHRPLAELGSHDRGWLKAKHHFRIFQYGNPAHLPVGRICAWNDDEIAPGTGFGLHPHEDMEIITYVREGAITHEDSLGNRGRIEAGDVQVTSAGTGIRHSEHNHETIPTRIFQIWIRPDAPGGPPRWSARPFPKAERAGVLVPLASGRGAPDALPIRADAEVFGALLHAGDRAGLDIEAGHGAYLVPARGTVRVNGVRVEAREGVALRGEMALEIEAETDAEIVLVVTGP